MITYFVKRALRSQIRKLSRIKATLDIQQKCFSHSMNDMTHTKSLLESSKQPVVDEFISNLQALNLRCIHKVAELNVMITLFSTQLNVLELGNQIVLCDQATQQVETDFKVKMQEVSASLGKEA